MNHDHITLVPNEGYISKLNDIMPILCHNLVENNNTIYKDTDILKILQTI